MREAQYGLVCLSDAESLEGGKGSPRTLITQNLLHMLGQVGLAADVLEWAKNEGFESAIPLKTTKAVIDQQFIVSDSTLKTRKTRTNAGHVGPEAAMMDVAESLGHKVMFNIESGATLRDLSAVIAAYQQECMKDRKGYDCSRSHASATAGMK